MSQSVAGGRSASPDAHNVGKVGSTPTRSNQEQFLTASEPYVDPHYAQKVWKQGQELRKEDRQTFDRKVRVFSPRTIPVLKGGGQ